MGGTCENFFQRGSTFSSRDMKIKFGSGLNFLEIDSNFRKWPISLEKF